MQTNWKALLKNELHQTRKVLLVWLAGMLMLCGFCYFEFLSLQDSLDEMALMLNQYPRLLMILFGVKGDLRTALGWYSCIYFWTGLLAFPYALYLGVTCLSREIKRGTAEYLFTKPVHRRTIVLTKTAASVINLLLFAACSGIGIYTAIILPMGGLEPPCTAFTTILGMFLTQLALFALGLLLSSILPTYKRTVRSSVILMFVLYTLSFTAEYTGIRWLNYLTPLRYFDVYNVALSGIQLPYLLLTVALFAACLWTAIRRWNKREF